MNEIVPVSVVTDPAPAATAETTVEEEATVTIDTMEYLDEFFHEVRGLLGELISGQTSLMSEMPQEVKDTLSPKASTVIQRKNISFTSHDRHTWSAYNPVLVADALFAIAKVASFLKMISLTVVNKDVGPMQISLGGMITDIVKFLFIFCFVWFAFSLGMNQLYWYYSAMIPSQPFGT